MKLDFTKPAYSVFGEQFKDEEQKPLTFKDICIKALLATFRDESELSGDEKYKRFKIARKIDKSKDEIEIPSEDIAQIKKLVGKAFGPDVVGPVYDYLEGKSEDL